MKTFVGDSQNPVDVVRSGEDKRTRSTVVISELRGVA
jgi:hypothetical protein